MAIAVASFPSLNLEQTRSLRMTRSLGQAINLLRFSNRELTAFLAFHEAVNPHLVLRSAADAPGSAPDRSAPRSGNSPGAVAVDQLASSSSGLHEHVRREIRLVLSSEAERSIAEHFIESLEATGWLDRPVETIAHSARCTPAAAEAVLRKIQQIDPPGLFARSLAECLKLQAADADILTPALSCLLDNLPLLARGEFDALAKICECDRKAIVAHFTTIRSFNPKPGLAFGTEEIGASAPDLIVALGLPERLAKTGPFRTEYRAAPRPGLAVGPRFLKRGLSRSECRRSARAFRDRLQGQAAVRFWGVQPVGQTCISA